jgi:hypothetical protein
VRRPPGQHPFHLRPALTLTKHVLPRPPCTAAGGFDKAAEAPRAAYLSVSAA